VSQPAQAVSVSPTLMEEQRGLRFLLKRIGWLTPAALLLLVIHMAMRVHFGGAQAELGKGFDTSALVLIALAFFPQLASYISSINIPGVGKFVLQTEKLLTTHTEEIDKLKVIIACLLSNHEANALKMVREGLHVFSKATYRPRLTHDLRRIRDLGMIDQLCQEARLAELAKGSPRELKISDCFCLTDRGEEYYQRRVKMLGSDGFELPARSAAQPDPRQPSPQPPLPPLGSPAGSTLGILSGT
jgi:hypothetical protein